MVDLSKTWSLDPRLERDTIPISTVGSWQTRLMNDKRWPWLVVIPKRVGAADIEDLPNNGYNGLIAHLRELSINLKKLKLCTSTNVATIGNIVTQMHWHVVGRNEGDPNWPGPVWGYEKPVPYGREEADAFIAELKRLQRFPL